MASSGQSFRDLELTRDEVERIGSALKDKEFRKLLVDYVEEIQGPENKKIYEAEIKELERERGVDVTFINPVAGYVIKTSVNGCKKGFINICSNENVKKPTSTPTYQDGLRGLQWSLPHSISPPREDVDNKGQRCQVFDIVFHPDTLHLAKNNTAFRDMVNKTATEAIEANFDVTLDTKNLKFPKLQYKGMPHSTVIRKPSGEKVPEKSPEEQHILDKLYETLPKPDFHKKSKKYVKKPEDKTTYTTPKYLIKHRSHLDIEDFTFDRNSKINAAIPKELILEVQLPLLKSASDIILDVAEKSVQLTSEKPAKYKLSLTLPYVVNQDSGNAKFDKDSKKLIITLPVKRTHFNMCDLNRDDSGVESDHGSPVSKHSDDSIENTDTESDDSKGGDVKHTKNRTNKNNSKHSSSENKKSNLNQTKEHTNAKQIKEKTNCNLSQNKHLKDDCKQSKNANFNSNLVKDDFNNKNKKLNSIELKNSVKHVDNDFNEVNGEDRNKNHAFNDINRDNKHKNLIKHVGTDFNKVNHEDKHKNNVDAEFNDVNRENMQKNLVEVNRENKHKNRVDADFNKNEDYNNVNIIENFNCLKVSNNFLNPDLQYVLPETTCFKSENTLIFTIHVKNVDENSIEKILFDTRTIHLKFTNTGSSFFPIHYSACFGLAQIIDLDTVSVEAWDNNIVLQISCSDDKIVDFKYGLTEDDLSLKLIDEIVEQNKPKIKEVDKNHEVEVEKNTPEQPVKAQKANIVLDTVALKDEPSRAIDIAGACSESSGDELSCSYSPSRCKGILKRISSSRSSVSRSISESSIDDLMWASSFENCYNSMDSVIPEDGEVSSSLKKTVRFNDNVTRQLFRSNSSILGQKRKNQRKAKNKKRAQERRCSESELSESEEKKEREPKTTERQDDEEEEIENKKEDNNIFEFDM